MNKYIDILLISSHMITTISKADRIKKVLKWALGGFTIFFVAILFFMTVHDILTGESSNTIEYCSKYGFLASPECW
jgi:hypothetical protein